MTPMKPNQTLAEMKDILLPLCNAITQPRGVNCAIEVQTKANQLMLLESKPGFIPLPYGLPRAMLESSSFMDQQLNIQVASLCQIVIDQPNPSPVPQVHPAVTLPSEGPTVPVDLKP